MRLFYRNLNFASHMLFHDLVHRKTVFLSLEKSYSLYATFCKPMYGFPEFSLFDIVVYLILVF